MSLINSKHFIIYNSHTDEEIEIYNLAEFARNNNLEENGLRDVIKGRQKQHRGFYGKECGSPVSLRDLHIEHTKPRPKKHKKTKRDRYKQTDKWVDFIENCGEYHQLYHIEKKLSCQKIGKLVGVAGELIRLQFKKNNLQVIKYSTGPDKGINHPRYKVLNDLQKELFDNFPEVFSRLHMEEKLGVWEISKRYGVSEASVHNYRKRYNLHFDSQNKSRPHKLITQLLEAENIEYKDNCRNIIAPKEIDIFIPSMNLGIEINGVYWHSETKRGKTYHAAKHRQCAEKNIKLIQFFDDEISDKYDICASILRTVLGKTTNKIYARDTELIKLASNECFQFLNDNHIQGARQASICYGLFYKNELVQVMTFSKDSKYQYQLIRLCTKLNTTVVGGANKLLTKFKKEYIPSSIVSYCDVRLFDGRVYEKMGFDLSHTSPPNYYYFHANDTRRKSRLQFQKHKLEHLLPVYDKSVSEWQNMQNNNYDRVWDCGNKVYVWNCK